MPARHVYLGACSARARSAHLVPARHPHGASSAPGCLCLLGTCPLGTACACSARARSALLVKCPLGTVPARHCLGARSAPPCLGVLQLQDEPTYGLTGKKHDMQNRAKNHVKIMSCKNHAKPCKKPCQNHVTQTCKTVQKPCQNHAKTRCHVMQTCKNHATCGAYAGVYTGQVARQGFYAGRGNPLNPHGPPRPCYMCYMCYISQGKPLNIHSPPGPCYMYYMCYMALYSIYSTDFARTEYIAHIAHIARTRGRVGVPRLGV